VKLPPSLSTVALQVPWSPYLLDEFGSFLFLLLENGQKDGSRGSPLASLEEYIVTQPDFILITCRHAIALFSLSVGLFRFFPPPVSSATERWYYPLPSIMMTLLDLNFLSSPYR